VPLPKLKPIRGALGVCVPHLVSKSLNLGLSFGVTTKREEVIVLRCSTYDADMVPWLKQLATCLCKPMLIS
jgi:hypothetical protein